MEQILDRLERGEIVTSPAQPPPPAAGLDDLIQTGIETVRRHLIEGQRRRPPRGDRK